MLVRFSHGTVGYQSIEDGNTLYTHNKQLVSICKQACMLKRFCKRRRWGSIHVFKPEREDPQKLTVRVGLTRLTIFPGHVDLSMTNVNDDMSALSRSTPISTFMR